MSEGEESVLVTCVSKTKYLAKAIKEGSCLFLLTVGKHSQSWWKSHHGRSMWLLVTWCMVSTGRKQKWGRRDGGRREVNPGAHHFS